MTGPNERDEQVCETCEGYGRIALGWTDKNGYPEDQFGPCPDCSHEPETTTGPNERDEIAAVLAKTLYEHSAASTFDATCGTCVREREHARALSGPLLDWLAERDRRTAATAVREAAEGLNSEGLDFKQGCWESSLADIQTIDVMVKAVRWLRDRADRIEAGQ